MMRTAAPYLSIVAPFLNEAEGLGEFCSQLRAVLDSLGYTYEVILVDDGSTDSGVAVAAAQGWPQLRILELTANVGHQRALDAGLYRSTGELVITMDADLQHPPSVILSLVQEADRTGADVVFAARPSRSGDRFFKGLSARLYYKTIRLISGIDIVENAADFRLMRRNVVDQLNLLSEDKVFRLLIPALGFQSAIIYYDAEARYAGTPKYNFGKSLRLGLNGAINFSPVLLRLTMAMALLVGLSALVWLFYVVGAQITGHTTPGWASIAAIMLILGSAQLFAISAVGIYVEKIFVATKQRPPYIIKRETRSGPITPKAD
jgi:dolichol-phosphate mannosyltransferase